VRGSKKERALLAESPVPLPRNYRTWVNEPEPSEDLADIRESIRKGIPYGMDSWRSRMVERHNLGQALREPGRPRQY